MPHRPPPLRRGGRAEPAETELAFHLQAADLLRRGLPPEAWFFHVPNEGKRSMVGHILQRGLGMVPGMADLILVCEPRLRTRFAGGAPLVAMGFLELKRNDRKSKLRPSQEDFRDFCGVRELMWGEARTLEEVEAFARDFLSALGHDFRARVQ